MDIACCGMVYTPTLLSKAVFFVLLTVSVFSAFYVNAVVYFFIFCLWLSALCFAVPALMSYRAKRVYSTGARFIERLYSNALWHKLLTFLIGASGLVVICLREMPEEYHHKLVITAAGAAVTAVLVTLFIAAVRVRGESKMIRVVD